MTPDRLARLIAAGALGMTVANAVFGRWMEAFLMLVLGLMLVLNVKARKAAFYAGWIDGRINLINMMTEAGRRGFTPEEAMVSVVEKDMGMMAEHLGQRSARKFREHLAVEMAKREDGSHEDL